MYVRFLPDPPHLLSWIIFVFFWKVLQWMTIIASAAMIVRICRESLKTPDGIYYEKDFDICRKRYVWKQPLFGFELDWYPFLTSHKLFWNGSTSATSNADKVLQQLHLPFGLKGADLLALETLQWIPHQEIPESVSSLQCRRCIVVGNGHSLHGKSLGKFIDSHNVVIRINDAPLRGYEDDVGKRTTFRFFFPESALLDPLENSGNDTVFILVPFKKLDFLWVKKMLQNRKEEKAVTPREADGLWLAEGHPAGLKLRVEEWGIKFGRILSLNHYTWNKTWLVVKTISGFWRQPPMEWKGRASHMRIMNPYVTFQSTYQFLQLDQKPPRYSTTGMIALNFALHICQEVNIAGFGYPPENDRRSLVHYYGVDRLTKDVARLHNLKAEREWLLKLQEREFITDVLLPPAPWVWGPRPQW